MQRFVSPQLAEAFVFPEPLRASDLAGQRVLFACQQASYEALSGSQVPNITQIRVERGLRDRLHWCGLQGLGLSV